MPPLKVSASNPTALSAVAATSSATAESRTTLSPRPLPADEYLGSLERGTATAVALVGGRPVSLPRGSALCEPPFRAEAGKPFSLVLGRDQREQLERDGATRVELCCKIDGSEQELRAVIADGARDRRTGALICLPGKVQVPTDARGTLRMTLEVTGADGTVKRQWTPELSTAITPAVGAALSFDENWGVAVDGVVRGGERLTLAYDVDRMRKLLGSGAAQITACVSFDGAPAVELPLTSGESDPPFLPALTVPYDASSVSIWFRGTNAGGTAFDSCFGRNYTFAVALPIGNLDPRWKAGVLASPSYPRLTLDNFDVIVPHDDAFNCIAWSLGRRREWLWPGDTVEVFDRFYAEHGFHPNATGDLSFVPGTEKVALFGADHSFGAAAITVTHAARMEPDGTWTSKLGRTALIRHPDVRAVGGPLHGEIIRVYERAARTG